MLHGQTSPNRLDVWGDGLLNKLKSKTRKRRKREASKKRRVFLKKTALVALIGLGFNLGFAATISEARAETTQEILQQIIKDLIANPPATNGDYAVGEQMC